jgi:chorismate--pyruvate lyase
LYASGSLTQQLTDLGEGAFHVERLNEQFQRLTFNDSQWMQMPAHHIAWVRETNLYGNQAQAWVKAKVFFQF